MFSWRGLSAQGVSRICAHDCIRAVTYLMTEVTLGSKTAIKMAMYYVILQFVFIIVSCISWQYHLMVYHVSFCARAYRENDAAKTNMGYTQISPPSPGTVAGDASQNAGVQHDKNMQLDGLLRESKNLHSTTRTQRNSSLLVVDKVFVVTIVAVIFIVRCQSSCTSSSESIGLDSSDVLLSTAAFEKD